MAARLSAAICAIALLLFSQTVDAFSCIPVGKVARQVTKTLDNYAVLADFDQEATWQFLDRYNQIPPPSTLTGDRLIVLEKTGFVMVQMLLGRDGCWVATLYLARTAYDRITAKPGA